METETTSRTEERERANERTRKRRERRQAKRPPVPLDERITSLCSELRGHARSAARRLHETDLVGLFARAAASDNTPAELHAILEPVIPRIVETRPHHMPKGQREALRSQHALLGRLLAASKGGA